MTEWQSWAILLGVLAFVVFVATRTQKKDYSSDACTYERDRAGLQHDLNFDDERIEPGSTEHDFMKEVMRNGRVVGERRSDGSWQMLWGDESSSK